MSMKNPYGSTVFSMIHPPTGRPPYSEKAKRSLCSHPLLSYHVEPYPTAWDACTLKLVEVHKSLPTSTVLCETFHTTGFFTGTIPLVFNKLDVYDEMPYSYVSTPAFCETGRPIITKITIYPLSSRTSW